MRRLALGIVTVAMMACLTAPAHGAPAISASGATNPVAWGIASLQWTHFWVKTSTPDAWAIVWIASSRGVERTLYNGPLAARPVDSGGRTIFPSWNGKGDVGGYLATGNYQYWIELSKGGVATHVSGPIAVSKSRWTLDTRSVGTTVNKRYLYAGPMWLYMSGSTVATDGDAIQVERTEIPPAVAVPVATNPYPVFPGSPVRNVVERWSSSANRFWNWQIVKQDPTTVGILTVIQ
jgi:hypothetical protein